MSHTIAPLKGLDAATFTPLREDRSLHLEAIAPIVERLIDQEIAALYVLGNTYNFAPAIYQRLLAAFAAGDMETVRQEQLRSQAIVRAFLPYGPRVAQKAIMKMIGIDCGPSRQPVPTLTQSQYAALERISTTSINGATGWSTPRFIDELYEPGCMAGIVNHLGADDLKGPLLLFSNVQTTERAHSSRRNLTIHLSRDGGITWPVRRLLEPEPSAYSDLAVLLDGQVLCCFEDGSGEPVHKRKRDWAYTRITVARFNLQWLLQSGSAP